ncbi:MAG: hypothetical protein IKO30_01570 [Lachnospiraceae bacterium]|nr:hypothetical protein [Lachnospiraceae bacterium]
MRNVIKKRMASAICAFSLLFSSVYNIITFPIGTAAEPPVEDSSAVKGDSEKEMTYQSFELYPNGEEADQVITLDGLMPNGAAVDAVDVSSDYEGIAAYDITITDGNTEFQPGEGYPILVEISDPAIPENGNVELWHILDNGEREQVECVSIEGGKISFFATGFSVYEIVADAVQTQDVESIFSKIAKQGENGLNVSYYGSVAANGSLDTTKGPYYMTGTVLTGIKGREGLEKTTNASEAVKFYFEHDENLNENQFYIYILKNDTKYYLKMYKSATAARGGLTLDADEDNKSLFTFEKNASTDHMHLSAVAEGTKYYVIENDSPVAVVGYTSATDKGTAWFSIELEQEVVEDYNLDCKTYGLMNYTGGTHGYALMAGDDNVHTLIELVTHQTASAEGVTLYVDEGSEVTEWTFHKAGGADYKLSASTSEGTKYLAVSGDNLVMTDSADSATAFKVNPDDNGRIQLSSEGKYVSFKSEESEGVTINSFALSTDLTSGATWLSLIDRAQLDDSDLITYSAERISVSEAVNGQKVIVYVRVWNENEKRYDTYAVDHDGSLYPCYASGGKILWLGDGAGTLEWEFTEYYDAVTKLPNYYYELYNPYSEKYIAPQITTGQTLSDNTIGINMQGRRNGDYYSEIVAWDNQKYAYIGLKPNAEKTALIPCAQSQCASFYFATLDPIAVKDELHPVATIDNNLYGITIKMQDFPDRPTMSNFLGSDVGGATLNTVSGLLSTNIGTDGYPTVTKGGKSLKLLFDDPTEVNHLFIENIYNSSGYFEFDSCQNTATLVQADGTPGNTFTVYKELATDNSGTMITHKHGQFFPYNTIVPGQYSTYHPLNLYDALQKELSEDNPRKYEKLYLYQYPGNTGNTAQPNCYNGMELEASFVQTVSGLDAWGHDIIFEFTGDDDFWLYVDGELIIDLGGIHSALKGNVNFRTGEVYVNGTNTTLIDLFRSNYTRRGLSATEIETKLNEIFDTNEDGQRIFKDYTKHTMRIFYMERGAGASNLHMKFNMSSVVPGHVSVSKTLSGDGADSLDTDFLEYPFQIFYTLDQNGNGTIEDDEEFPLKNDSDIIRVNYQNSNQPVTFLQRYRPPGFAEEEAYENIYFINPTKSAEISFPDDAIGYRIVECAVDSTVYSTVKINGQPVPDSQKSENNGLISYSSTIVSADNRPAISFDNYVNDSVIKDLFITKKLLDSEGQEVTDDPATFNFRLYLSAKDVSPDAIPAANMHRYYVLSPDKKLCIYDYANGGFAETGLVYSRAAVKAIAALSTEDTDDDGDIVAYNASHDPDIESYGLTIDDIEFNTSGFGAISDIPARYTICVPGLPVGMLFKVTEDVKAGYGLVGYERLDGDKTDSEGHVTQIPSYQVGPGNTENIGRVILDSNNPQMEVHNKKGYGLTVNKNWSDTDLTTYHDAIYVAVYVKDGEGQLQLLENSVHKIESPATSTYYFWETLQDGRTSLEDYVVKEVALTGDGINVSADGVVTGYDDPITILDGENDTIHLNVLRTEEETPAGETAQADFDYVVSYQPGSNESAVRTDVITNTREGGLQFRLFKWNSTSPLAGGKFVLKNSNGDTVGTYTSDASGNITILYNFDKNSLYTLEQTVAPAGYVGLSIPVRILVDDNDIVEMYYSDGTTTWGTKVYPDNPDRDDDDWSNSKPGEKGICAFIDVYNKPFSFKVRKTDSADTSALLGGAHFALYKQRYTGISGYVKAKLPMTGFEDMETEDGVVYVCGGSSNRTINPGNSGSVYFLTETKAPFNYNGLTEDIIFRISPLGELTLITDSYDGTLVETESDYVYTLSVPNTKKVDELTLLTIKKVVSGSFGNKGKDFDFTITITGAGEGDPFEWAKNSSVQEPMPRTGGTFKMKHGDIVEIALPAGVQVTVTEASSDYSATFKLADQNAVSGNSLTFTLTGSSELVVTNTLEGVLPTGIRVNSLPMLLAALAAAGLLTIVSIRIARRRREEDM